MPTAFASGSSSFAEFVSSYQKKTTFFPQSLALDLSAQQQSPHQSDREIPSCRLSLNSDMVRVPDYFPHT